jgi:putative transposase
MGTAVEIRVSDRQRSILERWERNKADTPYRLVERSRFILLSADGVSNLEQGRRLGVDRQRPRRWRRRWAAAEERLLAAEREGVPDRDLAALIAEVLRDAERLGGPPTFTAEQLTQVIAIACELPEECGRPVTHWTPRELADEAVKRGVVESISPRHVDRLLKGGISVRTRRSIG